MIKTLTEKEVLKILKIKDFRHLTKEKVINLSSMLDRMDPEVAKKAIEQFPAFATTAKEILDNYEDIIDKSLEKNNDSVKNYYSSFDAQISALKDELKKENLSFDEKKEFLDRLLEISKMIGEKDSENKKFIAYMATLGTFATVATVAILASTLGGNTKIDLNDANDIL